MIKLQIPGGQANPAPPVGPALGQHGVNIMEFGKAVNAQTAHQNGPIPAAQRKRLARELGMRNPREDGIRKALAGLTTAAEVIEITVGDSD